MPSSCGLAFVLKGLFYLVMAAKLPFFKFDTSEWLVGDISTLSLECQGGFIALCALYWHYNCEVAIKKAKLKLGESVYNQLLAAEIIKIDGENISISFLNEQLEVIEGTKRKNSESGLKSAEKRKQSKQSVEQLSNDRSTTVQRPFNAEATDKIRDKIRLDKNKDKIKNNTKNAEFSDKNSSDHKKFVDIYFKWYKDKVGPEPKFTAADGKAMKNICQYFEKITSRGQPSDSWKFVLDNVDKWDPFYQGQKKVTQIESNLINIIDNIKNGHNKNGTGNKINDRIKHNLAIAHEVGRELQREREERERNNR